MIGPCVNSHLHESREKRQIQYLREAVGEVFRTLNQFEVDLPFSKTMAYEVVWIVMPFLGHDVSTFPEDLICTFVVGVQQQRVRFCMNHLIEQLRQINKFLCCCARWNILPYREARPSNRLLL